MKRFLAGAAIVIGAASIPCAAMADQIFNYTGQNFQYFDINSQYTAADYVSGTLDLAVALQANCNDCVVTPVTFSFSDGVQTLTQNSNLASIDFEFWTNALGQITQWNIDINAGLGSFIEAQNYVDADFNVNLGDTGQNGYGNSGSNGEAGTFTEGSVPEPSTVAVMATVLGAFGFAAVRRRKKVSDAR